MKRTASETPWGPIDTVTTIAPGVRAVSTASHGGFLLDPEVNARIPAPLRRESGAYEEDCEWAIVVVALPEVADAIVRTREPAIEEVAHHARKTALLAEAEACARYWFPEEFAEAFPAGRRVVPIPR